MKRKDDFKSRFGMERKDAEKERKKLRSKLPFISWLSEDHRKKLVERWDYLGKILTS